MNPRCNGKHVEVVVRLLQCAGNEGRTGFGITGQRMRHAQLGHEGEGSLHEYLSAQGWITSLGAGVSDFDHATSVLNIRMELTPAGKDQVDAIGAALFQYIDMIRTDTQ